MIQLYKVVNLAVLVVINVFQLINVKAVKVDSFNMSNKAQQVMLPFFVELLAQKDYYLI